MPTSPVQQFLESNPYHVQPDAIVYIDAESDDRITWREYIGFSKRLATGLRQSAAKPPRDARILIVSPNQPHYPVRSAVSRVQLYCRRKLMKMTDCLLFLYR